MTTTPDNPGIVTVTHSLSRNAGGLFVSVRRMAQSIHQQGLPMHVIGLHDAEFERDRHTWAPLEPRAHLALGPARLGFSPSLYRDVQAHAAPPSVIHLQGLWKSTSHACLRAARRHGAPVIISPRGMLDHWALSKSRLQKTAAGRLYENENLRSAACLHALGRPELDQIRSCGLGGPVAVIPNGVDLPDLLRPPETDPVPEDWRNKRVCLFLSRIHEKKGLIPLIRAFAGQVDAAREWVLAIAGPDDGGHLAEIEQLINAMGAASRIRWVGPQFDEGKDAWFRRADAFILPSFSEGLPIAVLEAFAYRVPVLMTDACNLPDAFDAGAALRVTTETEDLTSALRSFFALSDAARADLGHKGRELVESRYTWDMIGTQMIQVYRWMLKLDPRPDCVVTA